MWQKTVNEVDEVSVVQMRPPPTTKSAKGPEAPPGAPTCHGEDPHQSRDAAVPQQRRLHRTGCVLLLPPGLEGDPDTGSEHQ